MSSVAKGSERDSLRSVAEKFNATLPPAEDKRLMAALRRVELKLVTGPMGQLKIERDTDRGRLCTVIYNPASEERAKEDSIAFGEAILEELNPLADDFISEESAKIDFDELTEDAIENLLRCRTSLYCSDPLSSEVLTIVEGNDWDTAKKTLMTALETILEMDGKSEKTTNTRA